MLFLLSPSPPSRSLSQSFSLSSAAPLSRSRSRHISSFVASDFPQSELLLLRKLLQPETESNLNAWVCARANNLIFPVDSTRCGGGGRRHRASGGKEESEKSSTTGVTSSGGKECFSPRRAADDGVSATRHYPDSPSLMRRYDRDTHAMHNAAAARASTA